MNKQLRKAIMTRTRLLNKYRKYNSAENLFAYKRQRNLCVKLLRKSKKDFYNNLNVKRITDKRKFWQTIKPNFTDKTLRDERITLVEGDKVITEEKHVVKKFKDHFEKIVETLKIDRPKLSDSSDDPVLNAIENFSHHASVLKIKEARDSTDCFSFKLVSIEDIYKEIRALDASKATQSDGIRTKIIKNNSDIFSKIFQANLNNAIETRTFPEQLKYANVKPVFKKDSRTDKKSYRPISILPNISKIDERYINKKLEEYFQALLSKYQCGFRKGYSVINTLLPMIEKWRKFLDAGGAFGALLTDLSKAFDCLPHELLIAKLHAYGVDVPSLRLLHSYLTKRKQRVKLNDTYSSWSEILLGVPQGSILGPLLFNIFLCDLFQFFPDVDIANYANDTPHSSNINLNKVLHDLEKISDTLFKWFADNLLKANPEKSHLLTNSAQEIQINIGEITISNSKCEKLLGIHIDNKLAFGPRVRYLCRKASQKLNAFARIVYPLKFDQRKLLLNAFITSQFSYALAVWMFHNRKLNNHINRIHERALRIAYQDHSSAFNELLAKDSSFRIHDRNLQKLPIEIFEVKMKLPPEIMNEVFDFIECRYPLRNELRFKLRNICTIRYGIETVAFVGSRIWSSMPSELKESTSLNEFKKKI